mgnify:CR=1 FL=1
MKQIEYKVMAGVAVAGTTLTMNIEKALASPDDIFDADGGVGHVSEELTKSLWGLPLLMTSAAYIMGIGFIIAGLIKLKQYVDDPDRAFMKDALIRLGVGVGLIFLPWFINIIAGSMDADAGQEIKRANLSRFN